MTWLVIPTGDRHDYLQDIVGNAGIPASRIVIVATKRVPLIAGAHILVDRGPVNIHRWWNRGIMHAYERGARHVAIFNDDLRITPDVIPAMSSRLDETGAAICYVGTSTPYVALTGWAFMLNLASGIRPDERYRWYYGDNDLHNRAIAGDGVTCISQKVEHLHPGELTQSSEELQRLSLQDRRLFDEEVRS